MKILEILEKRFFRLSCSYCRKMRIPEKLKATASNFFVNNSNASSFQLRLTLWSACFNELPLALILTSKYKL